MIGFAIVVIPLSVGLIYSVYQVEVLAGHMQTVVRSSMETIESARQLTTQVERMERSARQYQILHDEAIYSSFQQHHQLSRRQLREGVRCGDNTAAVHAQIHAATGRNIA